MFCYEISIFNHIQSCCECVYFKISIHNIPMKIFQLITLWLLLLFPLRKLEDTQLFCFFCDRLKGSSSKQPAELYFEFFFPDSRKRLLLIKSISSILVPDVVQNQASTCLRLFFSNLLLKFSRDSMTCFQLFCYLILKVFTSEVYCFVMIIYIAAFCFMEP